MVIRKNPMHDSVNPPGQSVTPVGARWPFPSSAYKPVHGGYPGTVHLESSEHNEDDAKVIAMSDYFKDNQSE